MWADLGRALARLHEMPLPSNWDRPDALQVGIADPDVERISDFWFSWARGHEPIGGAVPTG